MDPDFELNRQKKTENTRALRRARKLLKNIFTSFNEHTTRQCIVLLLQTSEMLLLLSELPFINVNNVSLIFFQEHAYISSSMLRDEKHLHDVSNSKLRYWYSVV